MDAATIARCQIDPSHILTIMGKTPCPWQRLFLASTKHTIINIHRRAGKSFSMAVKGSAMALFQPRKTVLIICPSQNQAQETMRYCNEVYYALGCPVEILRASEQRIEYVNDSRILCLPASERTIVAYGGHLVIFDEASRIPDEIYQAVRPMRIQTKGQIVMASTPYGQSGFFFEESMRAIKEKAEGRRPDFDYIEVPANECPWITAEELDAEERSQGKAYVKREFFCSFMDLEGLVYPSFKDCLVQELPANLDGKLVGGVDFGWADPFVALSGKYDRLRDIIWITGERYMSQCRLPLHVAYMKNLGDVEWVADYHSPASIEEMRVAGLDIRPSIYIAKDDVETGIGAVTSRIETGRLRVLAPRCPNTVRESQRYMREKDVHGNPRLVPGNDHAMDALRYLVVWTDRHHIGKPHGYGPSYLAATAPEPLPEKLDPFNPRHRAAWEAREAENPLMWEGEV